MAAFDELGWKRRRRGAVYAKIARWLEETPAGVARARAAPRPSIMFRRIGITFAVYGDKEAAERLIPFDIMPRMLSRAEWTPARGGARAARQGAEPVPDRRLRRRARS